jgi:hypothetical protein
MHRTAAGGEATSGRVRARIGLERIVTGL